MVVVVSSGSICIGSCSASGTGSAGWQLVMLVVVVVVVVAVVVVGLFLNPYGVLGGY